MQYKRFGNTYVLRIDIGEEIVKSLLLFCGQEKISLAMVNAIGAANRAAIGVYDLESQAYHREDLDGFMEITGLSGSVTTMDGKPYAHLHATLADRNHTVHGGHVIEMYVGATCEMFVQAYDGEVSRKRDENLGINLLSF